MIKGYVAEVTEYESGWGSRPDGHIVCMNKEAGEKFAKRENGHVWATDCGSEFSTAGSFKLCVLTEKAKEKIEDNETNVVWVGRGQLKDFVEEM